MWIGAQAPRPRRREAGEVWPQTTRFVEQRLGPIALHPFLELTAMRLVRRHPGERHLVRAPRAFDLLAIDLFGAGPALRRPQHDHRPASAPGRNTIPRIALDGADAFDQGIEGRRHLLVHGLGIVALDEVRLVSVADEEALELAPIDAGEDGRARDLVAVEVQDRE